MLKETDRLLTCEFCKVTSYLLPKDFFRYTLPSKTPDDKDIVFFPYWRLKGMHFSCTLNGIRHRFIDVSHQALASRWFPISVGLRSQTLKMQLASRKTDGRFLQPSLPLNTVISLIEKRFSTLRSDTVIFQSHIGETLSMIYSPFYMDDKIYDAVLNTPIFSKLPNGFDLDLPADDLPEQLIRLIPSLCPACGWDLHGERDALILLCKNCNSLWEPRRNGFKKLKFAHIHAEGDNVIYLPFWRIKAEISGIELETYADLVRLANLPRVTQRRWADISFYFWTLGFKLPPRNFLNLSRSLTLSQPQKKLIRQLPAGNLYSVKLPVTEAVESLKIILASFIKPPEKYLSRLIDIALRPKSYLLVYFPFYLKHNEFIQPQFHMAINKNLLDLTGNL